MAEPIRRRRYLDWLRGLAVLIMIQAHVLDSWTRFDARGSWQFAWAMVVAGFGAPTFLFLAGASLALSAGSKARRSGDDRAAASIVMRRGAWILLLAFVFRLQAWALGWGSPRTLLKVDILNIMGPSMIAAAALWGAARSTRARCAAFAVVTLAISLLSPIVRTTVLLDGIPDPLEAYLRPVHGFAAFCFFPWSAFLFAGALIGTLLDAARSADQEFRLNARLAGWGAAVGAGAYAVSFLPGIFAGADFWGASPAFFVLRTGILVSTVGLAYFRQTRLARNGWSPVEQLGKTSLFIYWIHVEMVYGLISLPIHKSLSHAQAWAAYGAFVAFMLLCSVAKDRVVRWWGRGGPAPSPGVAVQGS